MKNKLNKSILYILTIILFGACASKKPAVEYKPQKLPSWYLQPYNDTKLLYGTGEGKNQDEAVANALNTLVSKLSISISSKYESQTNISQHSYNKKSSQKLPSLLNHSTKRAKIYTFLVKSFYYWSKFFKPSSDWALY